MARSAAARWRRRPPGAVGSTAPFEQGPLGVPSGWSDENQWYWSGFMWKRRPWKTWRKSTNGCSGRELRLTPETNSTFPISMTPLATSSAGPARRSSLVSGSFPVRGWWRSARAPRCSLVFSSFSRGRGFGRPGWRLRGLAFLPRSSLQPSVMFLVLESAVLGVVLTLLGLVIEGLIVRSRSRSMRPRRAWLYRQPAGPDSSLEDRRSVGSDDSTAIRVRVPVDDRFRSGRRRRGRG